MKFIKRLLVFVLPLTFLLLSLGVYAQNPSQIDILTTEDGLLFRDVSNIVQDDKGLMWIGTNQGLNRYDGHNFKAYTSDPKNPFFLEEDFIKSNLLYNERDNALWFLANDELFQLELPTDSIFSFDKSHNLKGMVLDIFKAPDNSIWVVTDDYWNVEKGTAKQYLQKLVDGSFKVMVAMDRYKRGFNKITSDAKDFIWWATTSGTYKYTVDGNLLESHILDTYDWNGDIIHYVPLFFSSSNTHYYFPSSQGGINVYDASTKTSKRVFDKSDVIRYAIEDQDQNIWFAGYKTLYRMDTDGNFSDYTPLLKSKLDYSTINNLYIDQNSLLWVATDNGLFKIRTQKQLFTNLFKSEKEGWGNSMRGIFEDAEGRIFSLCESKHQIWFKSKNGQIDSLPLKTTSGIPFSLMYDASFLVTNNKKTHAYAIGKGISEIDLQTGQTKIYDQFSTNNKIYGPNALLKLKDGRLLFGYTLDLLTLFNPETQTSQLIFKNITEQTNIADLQFFEESNDPNSIWVGTKNDGVLKIDLNGNILKSFNTNTTPKLDKHHVLCLEEDPDGSLWLGTYGGGLSHISADGKTILTYTKTDGLPNDNVVAILQDGENKLWISTYNGLTLFNKATKEFQNFYTEDGLSHNEFNYSSFFKDSQGLFYFGGMNGINVFNADELQESVRPPDLKLLTISGYNSKTKKSFTFDYAQKELQTFTASPYDQYFEISWTMPSYFQNQKNTYSTMLEGFDDRWFYQGSASSIRYNLLPAGDYQLKIKGKDSRGNESASMLSIPITVKQIFYKKWWFIALVLLVIIGIMYAIFRYRFQQAIAMERLRSKISRDLHDDVGSLLSGLAMQTELMEMDASKADKSKLQKIAGISRKAISQMRDLVWSIDSRRETTNDLIERMQELAEELLLPKGISFTMESASVKYPNRKLRAQVKQNIFLIYKEAITNIIRHSDATHVTIAITNHYKICEFSIKDNGSKKACYKSTGLGLSNMQLRAEDIKSELVFKTDNGFGVILNLPFNL
ncbi:two-component regulator propeller domain-containing protein [Hwangdonia seohaensis]|uniref:Two-component regulator propeller domain-containing protein n=1 Tax=Hwangdonia seohaensis TaxID=1240727 RepID=A0ABW3R7F7_9FLAO|nr:two-component regulator propeller domain-containing protein [Hwangdonia seohaensis]